MFGQWCFGKCVLFMRMGIITHVHCGGVRNELKYLSSISIVHFFPLGICVFNNEGKI